MAETLAKNLKLHDRKDAEHPSGSAQLGQERHLLVPMIVAGTSGVLNSQLRWLRGYMAP